MSLTLVEPQKPDFAANEKTPKKFSMRGLPLLSQGATFDALATTDNLWLSVKVYSSGGENALHAHRAEDHSFIVMQGRAVFHFGDGSSQEVRAFEGVLLPKGTVYSFEAGEEENLVLLRVGGAQRREEGLGALARFGVPLEIVAATVGDDGKRKDARDAKSGTPSKEIVKIPGRFFPEEK